MFLLSCGPIIPYCAVFSCKVKLTTISLPSRLQKEERKGRRQETLFEGCGSEGAHVTFILRLVTRTYFRGDTVVLAIWSCQGSWEMQSPAGRHGAQFTTERKKGVWILGIISSLCYRGQDWRQRDKFKDYYFTDIENKLMVTKGEMGGGIN